MRYVKKVKWLLIFLLISILITRFEIFSSGFISGGDWGFPASSNQIKILFFDSFSTWTHTYFSPGLVKIFNNGWPFNSLLYFLSAFGFSPDVIQKLVLFAILTFSGYSVFLLLKYYKINSGFSLIGGIILMTSPVFFNYIIMGWQFVILSIGLLALFLIYFDRSILEKKYKYSVISGLIMAISMLQSQSFIWFYIFILSSFINYINSIQTFIRYVRSVIVLTVIFFLLMSYLWIPIFFNTTSGILNSQLGLSDTSLGTWANLSYSNILRNWGSLYNFQFESSFFTQLTVFSYVPILIAIIGVILINTPRYYSLLLPIFITPLLYTLGPIVVSKLPFSDIYRDIARFLVLSVFSISLLVPMVLEYFFKNRNRLSISIVLILFISLLFNIHPHFFGELTKTSYKQDFRLHNYQYSDSYFEAERYLDKNVSKSKSFYFPSRSVLSVTDDKNFNGYFHEIWDVFGGYSESPGIIGESDRIVTSSKGISAMSVVISLLNGETEVLNDLAIDRIVLRTNVKYPNYVAKNQLMEALSKSKKFELEFETPDVKIFKYIDAKKIIRILDNNATVEFKKINSTKYFVNINNVDKKVELVFSDSFNTGWVLIPDTNNRNLNSNFIKPTNVINTIHESYKEFSNKWVIDPKYICDKNPVICIRSQDNNYSISLIIEYWPQHLFNVGLLISGITSIYITAILFKSLKSKKIYSINRNKQSK